MYPFGLLIGNGAIYNGTTEKKLYTLFKTKRV